MNVQQLSSYFPPRRRASGTSNIPVLQHSSEHWPNWDLKMSKITKRSEEKHFRAILLLQFFFFFLKWSIQVVWLLRRTLSHSFHETDWTLISGWPVRWIATSIIAAQIFWLFDNATIFIISTSGIQSLCDCISTTLAMIVDIKPKTLMPLSCSSQLHLQPLQTLLWFVLNVQSMLDTWSQVQYFPLQLFSIYTHTHKYRHHVLLQLRNLHNNLRPCLKVNRKSVHKETRRDGRVKDRSWETPGRRLYIQIVLSKIKSSCCSGLVAGKKAPSCHNFSKKTTTKKQVKSIYMYTVHLKTQWMHMNHMC